MFDQLHDMGYLLVKERLADLERDRLLAEQSETPVSTLSRIADRIGDMLINVGSRLKRQAPCPDTMRELAWLDRK